MPKLRGQGRSNRRQPISRKDRERQGLSSLLRPLFQSPIHSFKTALRIPVEALRHEWNKQSGKLLVLNETDPLFVQCFNRKAVFAVKQARYPEFSEPTHLAIRLDIDHFGLESHRPSAWRLKPDLKLRPSPRLA